MTFNSFLGKYVLLYTKLLNRKLPLIADSAIFVEITSEKVKIPHEEMHYRHKSNFILTADKPMNLLKNNRGTA